MFAKLTNTIQCSKFNNKIVSLHSPTGIPDLFINAIIFHLESKLSAMVYHAYLKLNWILRPLTRSLFRKWPMKHYVAQHYHNRQWKYP